MQNLDGIDFDVEITIFDLTAISLRPMLFLKESYTRTDKLVTNAITLGIKTSLIPRCSLFGL